MNIINKRHDNILANIRVTPALTREAFRLYCASAEALVSLVVEKGEPITHEDSDPEDVLSMNDIESS